MFDFGKVPNKSEMHYIFLRFLFVIVCDTPHDVN